MPEISEITSILFISEKASSLLVLLCFFIQNHLLVPRVSSKDLLACVQAQCSHEFYFSDQDRMASIIINMKISDDVVYHFPHWSYLLLLFGLLFFKN
jgi:hypothetical protein